jgi:hypothetical protein
MRATERPAVRLACLLDGNRMSREVHVRFCERPVVESRRPTQPLFWTAADLEDKLQAFQRYFNKHRTHSGLEGRLPEPGEEKVTLNFASYRWKQHCRGLYQTAA